MGDDARSGQASIHFSHDDQGLLRLDEDECWRFLAKYSIGRVAIVHLGSPLVFPVNYALDGNSVVFRTSPGTKLAMAAVGAEAVFEVDDAYDVLETGASVMVHGTLQQVTDAADKMRIAQLPLRPWAPGDRDHIVRVEAKRVSGRRIPVHDQGDGLSADGG